MIQHSFFRRGLPRLASLLLFILSSLSASAYAQNKAQEHRLLYVPCKPQCWQALQQQKTPAAIMKQLQGLQPRLAAVKQRNVAVLLRQEKGKAGAAQVLAVQTLAGTYFARGSRSNPLYYTQDGKSLQGGMDRLPLRGHYVMTSGFNPRRRHPVTKKIRPHYGADWGAPRGTPVHSTGDGVVEFSGRQSGYGNIIIIKHAQGYETRYAHLHRRNVQKGQRVKRGQVIGSVGNTGMSTAVHLHYEVRINGKPYNPLKVRLPGGKNLSGATLKSWKAETDKRLRELNRLKKARATR